MKITHSMMSTIFIALIISISNLVFSLEVKKCSTCKWYFPNNVRSEYGLCTLFKEKIVIDGKEQLISNFAQHCRNSESLCGREGLLHEDEKQLISIESVSDISDEYWNEMEKFTKEGLELLFKVQKFNTKKICTKLDKFISKRVSKKN